MSAPASHPQRVDRAALVIGGLLAALAAIIFWQMAAMPAAADYAQVGPTTLPRVVAAGLALLAAGTVASAFRGSPERDADRAGPLLWIVGGLVLQMLLLKVAGFSVATGFLFAFTARGFGRGPIWATVPLGIAFAFVVWLIFAGLLQLSLPAGPLEQLIF